MQYQENVEKFRRLLRFFHSVFGMSDRVINWAFFSMHVFISCVGVNRFTSYTVNIYCKRNKTILNFNATKIINYDYVFHYICNCLVIIYLRNE